MLIKSTVNLTKLIVFSGLFFFSACSKTTYPRETIENDMVRIVERETGISSSASLVGSTFYLKVALPDLINTQADIQKEVMKNLQKVNLAIIRVSLSTNAKIDYLVMIVDLPGWKTNFSITQRLEDLKGFLYHRISKADYEERVIYDLKDPKGYDTEPFKDISRNEFIVKLILSKVNWIKMSNPFVNAALGLKLDLVNYTDSSIVLKTSVMREGNELASGYIEKTLSEWANKVVAKYKAYNFKELKVVDEKGKPIIDIKISSSAANSKNR